MFLCYQGWTLEQISAAISIVTPIILLFWFYYSQRQILSKNYFEKLPGIYGGFTDPKNEGGQGYQVYSGIIMNIKDIDNKGYFKGELDFAETTTEQLPRKLIDGIATFYGKLNFKLVYSKKRHPFKPKENRIHVGKLYLVDRLDFDFENYKIENYVKAEYDILHYREMQVLKFTLSKVYRKEGFYLPNSFLLYKTLGFNFEPYKNLIDVVFEGQTRVDKQ